MPGAGFTKFLFRKALSDMLVLESYWGKLTVRNLRGGDGDDGIIRSPVRTIALLDLLTLLLKQRSWTRKGRFRSDLLGPGKKGAILAGIE
jgi:hypothetical protein